MKTWWSNNSSRKDVIKSCPFNLDTYQVGYANRRIIVFMSYAGSRVLDLSLLLSWVLYQSDVVSRNIFQVSKICSFVTAILSNKIVFQIQILIIIIIHFQKSVDCKMNNTIVEWLEQWSKLIKTGRLFQLLVTWIIFLERFSTIQLMQGMRQ